LYNISILASFQTRDFSTFEIDNILSLIILAIWREYSGSVTNISSTIPKFFISFGRTVVIIIAIFAFALILSSFNLEIQLSLQAFVFFDSQIIVQDSCQTLFLTTCIISAHLIQVATSSILSIGKAI